MAGLDAAGESKRRLNLQPIRGNVAGLAWLAI